MTDSIVEKSIEKMKSEFHELSEELKRERDELKLQVHLFKAEAKEDWEDMEDGLKKFLAKSSQFRTEATNVSKETGQAISKLGDHLKDSYKKLKESIK